jgi:hypothetical protein
MLQRATRTSQRAEQGNRGYVRIGRALLSAYASSADRNAWLVGCEQQGVALRACKLNQQEGA